MVTSKFKGMVISEKMNMMSEDATHPAFSYVALAGQYPISQVLASQVIWSTFSFGQKLTWQREHILFYQGMLNKPRSTPMWLAACLWVTTRDKERALALLAQARSHDASHTSTIVTKILELPELLDLLDNPDFQEVLSNRLVAS
jgi:hypothetical protein